MNIALHGMEHAAGVEYRRCGDTAADIARTSPILVRYADDYIALCHSREQAEKVTQNLERWLAARGLAHNMDKTKIAHATSGVDFLGFNIRRYDGGKLFIRPSKEAVNRIRKRLSDEVRALRGAPALAVIARLSPIIRGWTGYYRTVVSSHTFHTVDHHLWRVLYQWTRRRHRNKPWRWVSARYFGQFDPARNDRWVFGDKSTGAYLIRFSWTSIVRHQMVTGTASPDDPAMTSYWAHRRARRSHPRQSTTREIIQQAATPTELA
jgi:RNA-directed DNA polymerase